jgi:hypothetical protein
VSSFASHVAQLRLGIIKNNLNSKIPVTNAMANYEESKKIAKISGIGPWLSRIN